MGFDVVTAALTAVRDRCAGLEDGAVADYIPPLALADPASLGLALTSMEGHRYAAGTAGGQFTIQSVSKPFVYALAVAGLGLDEVGSRVGVEPSGERFNAISLEPGTGRPANPMINAGAIATAALVPAASPGQRFDRIRTGLGRFAGRPLEVDEEVFAAESRTGYRNRALAFLMRSTGVLATEPEEAVETYFRQCSILVDTHDLSVMAATLANGGVNPVTGETVVPVDVAVQTLAVMATCGMYDASGAWMLRVGLPAKSGVSGCLIAASPGRFGVAVHSPRLDASGNSVRGVAALTDLSDRFGLHAMRPAANGGAPVIEMHAPGTDGGPALLAVQGSLDFTAAERVLSALDDLVDHSPRELVLDLSAVTGVEPVAAAMLDAELGGLAASCRTALVEPPGVWFGLDPAWSRFPDRLAALCWAEAGQ